MASSFVNEGLVDLLKGALAANPGPGSKPTACNLIAGAFDPDPALTYAGLEWASGPYALSVPGAWSFGLQAGSNYATAAATLSWTFDASAAGLTFFGVGLYDPTTRVLFYVETFALPYVVPSTGSTLGFTFNLNNGDCAAL